MACTRVTGLNASVFTLGGSAYIGDLLNATARFEVKTVEGKAAYSTDDCPVPVGRAFTLDGELFVSGSIALLGTVNSGTPTVSFAYTSGAATYSGTAVITNLEHRVQREDAQMFNISLKSNGPVLVAV